MTSSALKTDQYELTMLDAALIAGRADEPVTFEVFTRSLPEGRDYGVFAGLGRFLDAIDEFVFGEDELAWLGQRGIVSDRTLEWLANFRFSGDVYAYREGDIYTGGSPVLTVEAPFGQAVLLETVALSIFNHDSAVAVAASLISRAAGDRPVIEMGSRRTDAEAAVAAARAAYLGGLASTSNLEAGRRYGIPTAGTAAHAFTLLFPDERAAFAAQIEALGTGTTLLVDTFDTAAAIGLAIEVAGPGLAAIRIDSGELGAEAIMARRMLDELGAHRTRIIVTGDLDEAAIEALASCPADGYGAGTSVVTGLGHPTSGFVYKLAAVDGRPVEKLSPGKRTFGGRKLAWRVPERAEEHVSTSAEQAPDGGRALQTCVVHRGARASIPALEGSRRFHQQALGELAEGAVLHLIRHS